MASESPGVGMVAWGKNKSESRVTAEFYNCAVEVMRGAEAIDEYVALPAQDARPSCSVALWVRITAPHEGFPVLAASKPWQQEPVVDFTSGDTATETNGKSDRD